MKTLILGLSLVVLMMMPFHSLQAQNGLALGLKAGTTGFGADLSTSVSKKFNVRIGGSFYSHAVDGLTDAGDVDISYDANMSMLSIPALIDFYPANRGFKITGGIHYHDFLISANAVPNDSYTQNDKTFSPEKLGSLSGDISYKSKLVPYMGLGFGNALVRSRVKVGLDLGAMYTNSPEFTMNGTGMIAPTADQAPKFQDGLSDFKFYPVLNLSLNYRFLN